MPSRRRIVVSALSAALLFSGIGAGAGAATGAATGKAVLFNLTEHPYTKPARFYFQADAGPYLADLKWKNWGTNHASGRGVYILDCSSGGPACAPGDPSLRYRATYRLSGLKPCARLGANVRYYSRGVVHIDRPTRRTVRFDPGGIC